MALSAAERQRNFRARRRAEREEARKREPPVPIPASPTDARVLLARIGAGEVTATGARVAALRAVLSSEREEERTEGGAAMKRVRSRPLPTACPHCGQPIDYGGGS